MQTLWAILVIAVLKTVLYPQLTWQQNLNGKVDIEDGMEYNAEDDVLNYITSVMKTNGPQIMKRGVEAIYDGRLMKRGDESNNYDARLMKRGDYANYDARIMKREDNSNPKGRTFTRNNEFEFVHM